MEHRRNTLRSTTVLLALSALLGLAACGKTAGNGHDGAAVPAQQAQDDAHRKADEKLSLYVQGYNGLAQEHSLVSNAHQYLQLDLASAGRDSTVYFPWANMDRPLQDLVEARAIESDAYRQLDDAADPLIASLQTLAQLHGEHENYYGTKAYRDDDLALARKLDPQIRAAFTDAMHRFEALNAALSEAERARNEQQLAELRALPDPLPYATRHVLMLSQDLLEASIAAVHADTGEAFAEADAVKPQLLEAIAALDREIEKKRASEKASYGTHGQILFNARSLLSNYSDLRSSGEPEKIGSMVNDYNAMIDSNNRL
ncbi:DUF3829 domain-containing protein [Stenotrophomonas sp. MMGLT7]|uniref:DUF3829 domain-containing protein n=1 Tax=Stenotrophomonas sp. MMGLT7 TaxID=2901227 RepID=UPI001E5ED911|nr:DUF3829 domain-containing protein [Stenotrophomonas sp. MMGLT7]MCD7097804.1 YiiG family protein [Stenotrophomonas sp. MMGLT7]